MTTTTASIVANTSEFVPLTGTTDGCSVNKTVELTPSSLVSCIQKTDLKKDISGSLDNKLESEPVLTPIQDNKISSTLGVSSCVNDTNTVAIVTTAGDSFETANKNLETIKTPIDVLVPSTDRNKIRNINEPNVAFSKSYQQPIPALQYVMFLNTHYSSI